MSARGSIGATLGRGGRGAVDYRAQVPDAVPPFASGSKFWQEQIFARDMTAPTASHPITVSATLGADPTYADLRVGSFAQGTQNALCFRSRVPSVASHGTNAGSLVLQFVARPAVGTPAAPAASAQFRLYTRRIPDNDALAAWDLCGPGVTMDFNGSSHFRYKDWLSTLVLGSDINLVAGDFFEGLIYRETPSADEYLNAALAYALNLAWLAA